MSENQTRTATPVLAWSEDVDAAFFRLVATVFSRCFTDGATALLGSFDVE
jgi:hypothetical protein